MQIYHTLEGLSTREVEAQRSAGKGAVLPPPTSRSYAQIIREDVFTLVNTILFVLCLALLLLDRFQRLWYLLGQFSST